MLVLKLPQRVAMKNRDGKVLILGAFGQSNMGDDMMLESLVSFLRDSGYTKIFSNSSNPEYTEEVFGIRSFHTSIKKNLFKLVYHFLTSEVIIYGGGSILVELRMNQMMGARTPLYRCLLINAFAKLAGKEAIFCGIGVEEVNSKFSVNLIRWAVNLSTFCYVRDSLSYEVLKEYGCDMSRVGRGGELALMLETPSTVKNLSKKRNINRICIFPVYRVLNFDDNYGSYIKSLREYKSYFNGLGVVVEFCPMQIYKDDINNDVKVISDILEKNIISGYPSFKFHKDFLDYLSSFDLVLSSRYHGIVSATMLGIPAISITRFKKSLGFLYDMGLPNFSLNSNFSFEEILSLTNSVEDGYCEYVKLINSKKKILQNDTRNMLKEIESRYL